MITATKNTKPFYNTEIPGDWEIKPLFEVGKIVTGNTPSRAENTYWNGDICWATAQDFNDKYIFDTIEKVTKEGASVARILPVGSVLVTCIASIGNNALAAVPMATNQQINSIIPKKEYHNEWIYYYLSYSKQRLEILSGKTAVPIITKGAFEKFKIPLPPLPEQKAIAQLLSTADTAIHTNEKLIAQKELRKKWLMQQLLTGKKRLKGFGGEWKKERLEKYLVKHDEKSTLNNQYPVLTSSRRGIFLQSDYYTRDVASEDNTGYNVVPRGYFTYRHMSDDLIFKFNINDIVDRGIVSTLYPVFTTKDINSYFLLVKLNEGSEFKMHAEEQKQGGSRTYVYFKTLCQLKLNLPSLEEQTAIAQVLQAADKEISLLKAKAEKLREQKKGLMQVLLTGKVRLKINNK